MCKKVIIFGDTGMLGSVLFKHSNNLGYKTYGCSRSSSDIRIDVTNSTKVINILQKINPDIIINTVGITDIDYCEQNKFESWKVNSLPSHNLTNWVKKKEKKKIIFISTDQFFSYSKKKKNNEEDPINLVNFYGKTKLLGEYFSYQASNHLILRTNIISSTGNNSFGNWVIANLKKKKKMTLFDDYHVSSIDIYNFSKILFKGIQKDLKGTFNIGSSEVFSKKKMICEFSKQMNQKLINPCIKKSKFKVKRSLNCGLDVRKMEDALKVKMPNLSEVVSSVLYNYTK